MAAGGVTGEWSQRLSVSLPGNLPAPVLTARASPGAVDLSWEPVTGASRYELWTWWDEESGWQQLGGDNLTATTFSHAGLAIGATYYYMIRAVTASGGTSDWSERVDVPIPSALPPAATPTPTPTATATETRNDLPAPTPSATLGSCTVAHCNRYPHCDINRNPDAYGDGDGNPFAYRNVRGNRNPCPHPDRRRFTRAPSNSTGTQSPAPSATSSGIGPAPPAGTSSTTAL